MKVVPFVRSTGPWGAMSWPGPPSIETRTKYGVRASTSWYVTENVNVVEVVPLDGETVPLHRRVFWKPGQLAAAASPTRRTRAPLSPRTTASTLDSSRGHDVARP